LLPYKQSLLLLPVEASPLRATAFARSCCQLLPYKQTLLLLPVEASPLRAALLVLLLLLPLRLLKPHHCAQQRSHAVAAVQADSAAAPC
jgi:hypothetical protein